MDNLLRNILIYHKPLFIGVIVLYAVSLFTIGVNTHGNALNSISSSFFFLMLGTLIPLIYIHSLWQRVFINKQTKLPNRIKLQIDIETIDNPMLIIININCFRGISDYFGNDAGDSILSQLATRCKKMLPRSARIYQISSSEVAILANSTLSHRGYVCIGDVYLEDFIENMEKEPYRYDDQTIPLVVTIGAAGRKDRLIERSYKALEKAIANQKPFIIYSDEKNKKESYSSSIQWVKKVKTAIDENKIIPVFQPIFNNTTKQIEKYECLVRVDGDEDEGLTPEIFLRTAKRSRLYSKITHTMIDKSFLAFKDSKYDFSINLSFEDLQDDNIRKYIISKLRSFPDPRRVTFEILEQDGMWIIDKIKYDLDIIKKLGSKIAIDDFGTSCSNLAHIFHLSADYIKLESDMVKNILTDKNKQIFISTIVDFSKKIGIKIIAKYVETEQIQKKVIELGVHYSQGQYLGDVTKDIPKN